VLAGAPDVMIPENNARMARRALLDHTPETTDCGANDISHDLEERDTPGAPFHCGSSPMEDGPLSPTSESRDSRMRIGITCDLKNCTPPPAGSAALPDDWAEEFDDPSTIEALANVFRSFGHEVHVLGDGPELIRALLADPPDFVFNVAEGQGISRSREARVPALLEMLGIPIPAPTRSPWPSRSTRTAPSAS